MQKKDYSDYTLTEAQKYALRRRGNHAVSFSYFCNRVSFVPEHRVFHIHVDEKKENDWMDSLVEEYEAADAARRGLEFHGLEEDDDETRQEDWAQNQADAERFAKRYRISNSLMDDPLRNQEGKRKEPMPVNNVLSGAGVTMRYGDGILDFVYADFRTPALETMGYLRARDSLFKKYQEENPAVSEDEPPEKIYDQTQEIVEDYYRYLDTLPLTKKIMMQSLYTMICPPVFSENAAIKALDHYYNYLTHLQKEYLELLEFCFDETFYPGLLGDRHPAERFYLYRDLHEFPTALERPETVLLSSRYRTATTMPYGMTTEEIIRRMSSRVPITEDLRRFKVAV